MEIPHCSFYIRSALNHCYLQLRDGCRGKELCLGGKPCGDDKFLRWKYDCQKRAIISELNGYAIDVCQGEAKNCTDIIAYPCHGGRNQQWTFPKSGAIVSSLGCGQEWVLDVKASGGAGTPVILYTWHGGNNQRWYISHN